MSTLFHSRLVVEHLRARGETLALAESLTAGGVGFALTQVPGASQVIRGGIIAYTADVKIDLLGVSAEAIAANSVVSEVVAREMAAGALSKVSSTWAISTTGIAGPGDYKGIREGSVWIAIAGPVSETLHLQLDGGREGVRSGAISSAIASFSRILSARK